MPIQFSETQEPFEIGKPYPMKFRPILTGTILPDWCHGPFVVELASLVFHHDRMTIDYNHNETEILGYAHDFAVDSTGWIGDGTLLSLAPNDRASQVILQGKAGVPWEVSPTLMMDEGVPELVHEGQVVHINGMDQKGPFTIFRNVPVRGISICPYARDKDTNAVLKMARLNQPPTMMEVKKMDTEEKKDALNQEEEQDKLNEPEQTPVKDETLLKFTNRFGFERGTKLFQEGVEYDKIDEAFQTLKACGFTSLEEESDKKTTLNSDGTPAEPPKKAEESTALNEEAQQELKKLRAEVDRLKVSQRGQGKPLSGGGDLTKSKPQGFVDTLKMQMPKYN